MKERSFKTTIANVLTIVIPQLYFKKMNWTMMVVALTVVKFNYIMMVIALTVVKLCIFFKAIV